VAFRLKALLPLLAALQINAAIADAHDKIRVHITPECKQWFYGPDWAFAKLEPMPRPDYVEWDPTEAKPLVFKDPRNSITFYVESDGRHLAAIDRDGKLLWVRNPFEDAKLCPYRSPRPVIFRITVSDPPHHGVEGRPAARFKKLGMDDSHQFIFIEFDSSQMGIMDVSTGNFMFEGQN
jgi:hypothetical protein